MLKYFIVCFWVLQACSIQAQDVLIVKSATKKAQKQYAKAKEAAAENSYAKSKELLIKLTNDYPTLIDAWILLARIQFDQDEFTAAKDSYLKALTLDANYSPKLHYELGITAWRIDDFDLATNQLEQFLASKSINKQRATRATTFLANAQFAAEAVKNPLPFDPTPLPTAINTTNMEYLPSLDASETLLTFTRRIGTQEDFYFSVKKEEAWTTAQPIAALNTEDNEGAQSISGDGKTMVFGKRAKKGGFGGFDLYITYLEQEVWTAPTNLGANVNGKSWDAQPSISADGNIIFFASDRAGGLGGIDIWFVQKRADGSWTKAQNLGNPINTTADDQSPFLHADGQTLYFMSKGHPGMGGFDLYKSVKQVDSSWSTPQNLGYPINTKADEGAVIVGLSGKVAYFTSDQNRANKTDIFSFDMPERIRPLPVTYVQARVLDAVTNLPIPDVVVECWNTQNNVKLTQAVTDAEGEFLTILPIGANYAMNVSASNYLFHSENFELSTTLNEQESFQLDIYLKPVPDPTTAKQDPTPIVLNNIFFAPNAARLLESSLPELEKLLALLQQKPNLKIQINGHVADVGDPSGNQQLSEERAKAVYDYLIDNGIDSIRLKYKGFGASQPIASNETEVGRRKNRRTTFQVVE